MRVTVGFVDLVPAKGGTMGILPGVKFAALNSPATNDDGVIAFQAKLSGTRAFP